MLSSSSVPRRFRRGSKLRIRPMPVIITMLRKKSIRLRITAKVTVSLFTEASWRGTDCRGNTGSLGYFDVRPRATRRFPAGKLDRVRVAASRYGHQHLTGLHALVHDDGDVGDLAGDVRAHVVLHLHRLDGRHLVANRDDAAERHVDRVHHAAQRRDDRAGAGYGRRRRRCGGPRRCRRESRGGAGWRGGRRMGGLGALTKILDDDVVTASVHGYPEFTHVAIPRWCCCGPPPARS